MTKIKKRFGSVVLGLLMALGVGVSLASIHGQTIQANAAAAESITIEKSTNDLATENKWTLSVGSTIGTKITTFKLDENISVSVAGSGNTATIWNSNGTYDLRIYGTKSKENGSITFSGCDDGVIIKTIKLTFGTRNSPTISPSITSDKDYDVGANTQSFVMTSGKSSAGQMKITNFVCIYEKTDSTTTSMQITEKPSDNLEIGDSGLFAASTTNATNPTIAWSSSNDDVLLVSSDGEYLAESGGNVIVSASLTCDELSTPLVVTFDVVVNYGSVTIEEANTIANSLSGDTVTADYYLSITGYIVNLNGDSQATGKERMIVLSDKKESEEGGNQINVFGIYSSNALRDIAIINGTVTIKGKPAKYKGTAQLASPSYSNYTDDAIEFATMFNADLKTPCIDPSADNSASVSSVWSDLELLWEDVDSYAQAKLKAATTSDSDENIKNFAGLYDHIVNRYELSNFVGRTLTTSSLNRFVNRNESRDLTAFIAFASIVGIASIGGLFLIRKRRRASR